MTERHAFAWLILCALLLLVGGFLIGWAIGDRGPWHPVPRDVHAGVTTKAVRYQP